MKAVLITGSRDYGGNGVWCALNLLRPGIVIHGAAHGADSEAAEWCSSNKGTAEIPMPAQWEAHGRGAGPRRNAQMIGVLKALEAVGYQCIVMAFPVGESRGTRGCMKLAVEACFDVVTPDDDGQYPTIKDHK